MKRYVRIRVDLYSTFKVWDAWCTPYVSGLTELLDWSIIKDLMGETKTKINIGIRAGCYL